MTTAASNSKDRIYLLVRTRSILACFIHWFIFFSVVALTITGLYIAWPELYFGEGEAYQAFAMANVRYYHFIAASVMIACLIARFYLAFTASCNKDMKQFFPTPKNIISAFKLAKYFITLRGEHAHYRFINPLGGLGVFAMSLIMLLQVITGFALYLPGADPLVWGWAQNSWLESAMGGQQNIRLIHHLAVYGMTFVVLIHVYMQVWKTSIFSEADMSSIVGGYKIFPRDQIGQFADIYGMHLKDKPPSEKEMADQSTPMLELTEEQKKKIFGGG